MPSFFNVNEVFLAYLFVVDFQPQYRNRRMYTFVSVNITTTDSKIVGK